MASNQLHREDAKIIISNVCTLRGKMGLLFDFADLPIPFSYIHFINVMVFVYLPMFAFGVALNLPPYTDGHPLDSVYGLIVVLFYSALVIGLRDLSQRLQDPWGRDFEDLSVLHFVQFSIEQSRRILMAVHAGQVSKDEELEMSILREASIVDTAFRKKQIMLSYNRGGNPNTLRVLYGRNDVPIEKATTLVPSSMSILLPNKSSNYASFRDNNFVTSV
jgi:Bestrophin, RFP-TM, chloride channel